MTTIRFMTYNIHGCRGHDGREDPARILEVIAEGAPDLVALQELPAGPGSDRFFRLAEQKGLRPYPPVGGSGLAFLSRFPLRGLQGYELGGKGWCQRADLDLRGKRIHLFNLRLALAPDRRREQIVRLLGTELLGHPSLVCPTVVLGDFSDPRWWLSRLDFDRSLIAARGPLWSATYPARFPLLGRDRAYLRGKIRVLESRVLRFPVARQASSHLPLLLSMEVGDPGCYLPVKELKANRMEAAPG